MLCYLYHGCTIVAKGCTMVQHNTLWCKIIVPWWYKDAPWHRYNYHGASYVYYGIPLFTMVYHCSPWYTMVITWYLFIRECIVVISLGLIAQYNKTEEKILIIIFTEWQMMFKSMHQCSKNQMAQYLATAVQYFNYWSSLNARHCNFSHLCLYIYIIIHLCHGAKWKKHMNDNTTLVLSCWLHGLATAAWNGWMWIGMKIFNKKVLNCEK